MQESTTAEMENTQHGPEARVTGVLRAVPLVDPMPAGKLGMWLFLASEAMFFVGLLSAFIVLESAGSQHQLFMNSSRMLGKWLGIISVVFLIVSSAAVHWSTNSRRWLPIAAAVGFLLLQLLQCELLLHHHTAVLRNSDTLMVVDGSAVTPGKSFSGRMMIAPAKLDLHAITPDDFPVHPSSGERVVIKQVPNEDLTYGPSRNNFFACYFLMTAAHIVHLLAGMIAVLWFILFTQRKLPDAVQIYWHFVNAVGAVAFFTLYFV